MRRLTQLGALLLLVVAVLAACGGGENGGDGEVVESPLEQALRRMVLSPEDLPEGLARGGESFTTNDQLASGNADPEGRKAVLEGWGRLLGYEVSYQPSGAALEQLPVRGINVSASLYRMDEGAGESFAEAVQTSEETDWAANYAELTDFKQENVDAEGLADEIVWLRLSGFQPTSNGPSSLVSDDLIFFRVGRERGFLRVLASSTETEDRQHYQGTIEGWLRTLIQNVEDALREADLQLGEAE